MMRGQPAAAQGLLAVAHPGQGGGQGRRMMRGQPAAAQGLVCGGPPRAGWQPWEEDDEGPARGGPGPACGGPPGAGCEAYAWLFHWKVYAWLRLAEALLWRACAWLRRCKWLKMADTLLWRRQRASFQEWLRLASQNLAWTAHRTVLNELWQ